MCTYKDAAEYVIYKGIFNEPALRSGYGSSGMSSWSSCGSEDFSDFEEGSEGIVLPTVTISVDQLCRKIRKLNRNFKFEFLNEEEEDENVDMDILDLAETISPVKHQKFFC